MTPAHAVWKRLRSLQADFSQISDAAFWKDQASKKAFHHLDFRTKAAEGQG
jgi:hypothetical protein